MKLHVFPASPNARKAMMANELLGLNIPVESVDFSSGAHKSPEFLALNPNGKIPVLEFDDGTSLWESNVIVNRLATEAQSDIWPRSNVRYDILRWQFWEACHWTPACSKFISYHLFGNKDIDLEAAAVDFHQFAKVLDDHLQGRDWLVGDAMTTADISVSAYLCYRAPCHYPVQDYATINRWLAQIEALPSWINANPAPQAA